MTKILVTGANGQLGQSFQSLAEQFSNFEFIFTDLPEMDLCDIEKLQHYFKSNTIDFVVNCVAYTAVDRAEEEVEKAKEINAGVVNNLCELAKIHPFRLVHFSTDYVFDGSAATPYLEEDLTQPIGVYGKTKEAGEKLILNAGLDAWIIRTSWLFSPYGKNFVKTILSLLQNKNEIEVVADQTGSPTYAPDLAQFVLKAITQNPNFKGTTIYHFTNAGTTTWYDFALAIKKQINADCIINRVDSRYFTKQAPRPKYSVLNCEKIKKEFNLNPRRWESALKDCLNSIKH